MKIKRSILLLACICLCLLPAVLFVRISISGSFEGIFLLRGTDGTVFEIKDDLYLNEGKRYIVGLDFVEGKRLLSDLWKAGPRREPYLYFAWNERTGAGYVRNYLPGGKQVLTCFSRFLDDSGKAASGLFVGGGLPPNVRGNDITRLNETGMAYFDGARWFHLWCNVNEAMFTSDRFEPISPSSWKYLGSRVLHHEDQGLVLKSSHEVMIGNVPLRIDRYAHFRAGAAYFILTMDIKNTGTRPVTYSYHYGDEPWLGNYGSSAGNVGWAADGLHEYVGTLEQYKSNFVGFFDHGNDTISEGRDFTGIANFIEWFVNDRTRVSFTNGPYDLPQKGGRKVPLASNTRFLGILFGPKTLQPNESTRYTLAIGMADKDARTGFPVKPVIDMINFP